MPWYGYVMMSLVGLLATVAMAYCGWVARKLANIERIVSKHGMKIGTLERADVDRERLCEERLTWLRSVSDKIDTVAEDTAEIKGMLKSKGS